jgi:uncharacterized protein (TIGR00730 family)
MNTPMPIADTASELERRVAAIRSSPTYRLAEDDPAFMEGEAARASRLSLEFMRVDDYLRAQRIRSTVVVFGGSRVPPNSRWYEEARALGGRLARAGMHPQGHDFVVATGGGPGIMEAANRGAAEAGAPTIGFNIRLPDDQPPNPYVTPTLAFRFHYFALRKMHFLMRARALVAFPGGYGTLDELFEALNLVQTRVIAPMPIVLVGREHWRRVVDFEYLLSEALIDARDSELFTVVDSGADAARHISQYHGIA